MKVVKLTFEEEKLIRTEWIRKDEVEDYIVNCAHFYDHGNVVVQMASVLGLDYTEIRIEMDDFRLRTLGNPQWYCKHRT